MSFQVKPYETMVADMVTWIIANNSQISDLTPGSVLRSFCEATGLCLEELYISTYLGFKRYMDSIQENVFDFRKKAGNKASGKVKFTRTVPAAPVITIPIGTMVETVTGLKFLTTEVATIATMTSDSNLVSVEAEVTGTAHNVQSASVVVITETIDGVDSVTNPNAIGNGTNKETDFQYNQRFQAYIEGLGRSNIAGLIYGALSVPGIISASVQELFPPVANVNVRLYVDDGSATGATAEKLLEIKNIIDGDGTEDNPGYRAAGINVAVLAPTVIVQNVSVTAYVLEGTDSTQITSDINQNVVNYINTLGIGASIIWSELVAAVMSVFGVSDCTVGTPSGNVVITAFQVGRAGTVTVVIP